MDGAERLLHAAELGERSPVSGHPEGSADSLSIRSELDAAKATSRAGQQPGG
jgi:hypothetical protein